MSARLALAALLVLTVPARAQETHPHGDHGSPSDQQVGTVAFPVSCEAAAQPEITRAVAWLHSFEYEEAKSSFEQALAADPSCAIADWGVAMSQYHPLWTAPTPAELETGRLAIEEALKLPAGSARERAYIEALAAFYDRALTDHKSRTFAYEGAMAGLSAAFPADDEAAIFHAISMIAAGSADGDKSFARQNAAAAILNAKLADLPDHPGIAHYLIHAYDSPRLAALALPAARRYAGLAPASAHAQHMPAHIFIRLGLWDEAIRSNLGAEAAAEEFARRHQLAGSTAERLHAMDYLAYAYLQSAQDAKAEAVLADQAAIVHVDPPSPVAAYSFAAVPARLVLERGQWTQAAALALAPGTLEVMPWDKFRHAQAHIHFARAVGAARSGQLALARVEVDELKTLREALKQADDNYDWGLQVEIQQRIASAWLDYAEGRHEVALEGMRQAADLDDATEKHPVTPGQLLPAREELAELLLLTGRPADALTEYERTLEREPGRFNAIYGAAHAAREAGQTDEARGYYTALLQQSCGADGRTAELAEARAFPGVDQATACSARIAAQ